MKLLLSLKGEVLKQWMMCQSEINPYRLVLLSCGASYFLPDFCAKCWGLLLFIKLSVPEDARVPGAVPVGWAGTYVDAVQTIDSTLSGVQILDV
eukprot:scaffold38298_cov49-Attheya_sp.AAC.11